MADYVPKPVDLGNIAALLANGAPARNAMLAGVGARHPGYLSGWAGAEENRINQMLDQAFTENSDVNDQLERLAMGKNALDLAKSQNTLAGTVAGALPKGAQADMTQLGPIHDLFLDPEVANHNIGRVDDINFDDIIAGTNQTNQETQLMPFDSQTKRIAAQNSGSGSGQPETTINYDRNGNEIGRSVKQKGAGSSAAAAPKTAAPVDVKPGTNTNRLILDLASQVGTGESTTFPLTVNGKVRPVTIKNNGDGTYDMDFLDDATPAIQGFTLEELEGGDAQ